MTKYQALHARLNPANRYLLEERKAIKMDSNIPEDIAESHAVEEWELEIERKYKKNENV